MEVEKIGRTTGGQEGYIEAEIVGPWPLTLKTTTYDFSDDAMDFVGTVYLSRLSDPGV